MGTNKNYDDFYEELSFKIDSKLYRNVEMKKHVFFKIGGYADFFIEPKNEHELGIILKVTDKYNIELFIIGNGTNMLVSDKGFRGIIVKIGKYFSRIDIKGNIISTGAGALLSSVAKKSAELGLDGLVFACGIPGYVGGGVAMNAGAYKGEIKDVITKATCMTKNGEKLTLNKDELELGYRSSKVINDDLVVLDVEFALEPVLDKKVILDRIRRLNEKRTSSQPLNYPSAGSTFKRPEGDYAARLIEQAGLKGYSHGGAKVSDKHSGFVINYNEATCREVLELMEIIKSKVYDMSNIMLEPEVKIIGEF